MDELTTVFEITAETYASRSDFPERIVFGVILLIIGIVGLVRQKQVEGRITRKSSGYGFTTAFCVLWLIVHIFLWRADTLDVAHFLEVYRSGKNQIEEGIIHVIHEQRASGHSAPDKITVGDQVFEINCFLSTLGYKQTIANGGALREGVFARLHHYKGVILKAEVRMKEADQQGISADDHKYRRC